MWMAMINYRSKLYKKAFALLTYRLFLSLYPSCHSEVFLFLQPEILSPAEIATNIDAKRMSLIYLAQYKLAQLFHRLLARENDSFCWAYLTSQICDGRQF